MLAIIGRGSVGLPLATLPVKADRHVVGMDVDISRIELLQRGESYVDDVENARLRAALHPGRYSAKTHHSVADALRPLVRRALQGATYMPLQNSLLTMREWIAILSNYGSFRRPQVKVSPDWGD
jgi:UDP-N-acetyl-D-mannosaminuronate dehydrogenase